MPNEWIEKLAEDIRTKNRDAAEEFGRKQHYAELISTRGHNYFLSLVDSLQEDVNTLRSQLQGDPASAEMQVQTLQPDEVKITRERFPWVDARLTHADGTITLDYAKGPGLSGDPLQDRKMCAFAFQVAPDEKLFAEEVFLAPPKRYERPEDLAQHITELLFSA